MIPSTPRSRRRRIATGSSTVQTCTWRSARWAARTRAMSVSVIPRTRSGTWTQPTGQARTQTRRRLQPEPGHLTRAHGGAEAGPERGSQPAQAGVGERADAHAVGRARPADDLDEGVDRAIVLRVDVDLSLREAAQQVFQQGDGLSAVDPGFADHREGELGDRAGAVGHPVEVVVVEGEEDPVCRHVDVGLEVAVPERPPRARTPASCSPASRPPLPDGRTPAVQGARGRATAASRSR